MGQASSGGRTLVAAGGYSGAWPANQPNIVILLQSGFCLKSVLGASGQLRSSSDDAHVKVRRKDPQTGEVRERTFDCSANSPYIQNEDAGLSSYPWLHDGDEVEVPEKAAQ